jgi:hypothetical protein
MKPLGSLLVTSRSALGTTLFIAAMALSACSVSVGVPGMAGPVAFEPISTPGQFIDQVVGKPITFDNGGVLVANPDGTFGGDFNGVQPTGNWTFTGGQLCRTIAVGAQQYPEVCNALEVADGVLRLLNPDGTLSSEATLG